MIRGGAPPQKKIIAGQRLTATNKHKDIRI